MSEIDTRATATAVIYRISTEEVIQEDDSDSIVHLQDVHGDTRIRWVYFMLGAATLLSWNGKSAVLEPVDGYY